MLRPFVWAAVASVCWITSSDAADPPTNRKMTRQIDVMERIIDQVLIDSPNFLVHGRDNARGVYVAPFGVMFSFEASLVEKGHDFLEEFSRGRGFHVEERDGKITIIPRDRGRDRDRDRDDDEESVEDEASELTRELRKVRDKRRSREERLYLRGKAEFVDVLLDYGDTMTTLKDSHWIAIVAYLRDSDYFSDNRFEHLILKAKVGDVRSYSADKIDEEEMIKRIVQEEY